MDGEKIVISGASGALGGLTVGALLERGVRPTDLILVSRTPEALSRYAALGATVRHGDLTASSSLPAAYAGATRMLLVSIAPDTGVPGLSRPEAQRDAFVAAVAAGVTHIVYTSYPNLERNTSPLARDHRASEHHLKASGARWTVLRDNGYAEIAVSYATDMYARGQIEVPANDSAVPYISHEDVAAAAAAALLRPIGDDRTYEITGETLFDLRALARLVEEVTGRAITIIDTPARPDDPMFYGSLDIVSDAFRELTGRRPKPLRTVFEERIDLIRSGRLTDYAGRPVEPPAR